MKGKHFLWSVVGLILVMVLLTGPVWAALEKTESSTKTKGATTITWDSSFADFDYTLGDTIHMTVNWTVDAGAATYQSFVLKRYTPRSKKDPATGTTPVVLYPGSNGANSVDVAFKFTGLHFDKKRNVEIGNAHFKLYLMIDTDGDGAVDSRAGYGVNVHVEDPQ